MWYGAPGAVTYGLLVCTIFQLSAAPIVMFAAVWEAPDRVKLQELETGDALDKLKLEAPILDQTCC